jgi:hypothetical protein
MSEGITLLDLQASQYMLLKNRNTLQENNKFKMQIAFWI